MRLLLPLLLVLLTMAPAEELIYDDFEDGMADGWLEMPSGATYEVVEGRYHFLHSASDSVAASALTSDETGGMSVASYSIRAQIEIEYGDLAGVAARYDYVDDSGYTLLLLAEGGGSLALARFDQGAMELLAFTLTPVAYNQEYWVRFELSGDQLGAKVWTGAAGDEPAEWAVTVFDTTYGIPGYVGLVAWDEDIGGTASFSTWYDEFLVEDDLTLAFDASTWGAIKSAVH